ncbi:MAG: S41 family peptidase [Defluviitaleaceae bacterium]|nr:S41 family peptidase [Defluviitaleaceae bacterium]
MKKIIKKTIAVLMIAVLAASPLIAFAAEPLPIRQLFEDVGGEVIWDEDEQSIHVFIDWAHMVFETQNANVSFPEFEMHLPLESGAFLQGNRSYITTEDLLTLFEFAFTPGNSRVGTIDRSRLLPESFGATHQSGLAADALQLVRTIEATHPIFIFDDMLPDDYEVRRDEFLTYVLGDITLEDFVWAAQRYIALLQDGHMGAGFSLVNENGVPILDDKMLNVHWIVTVDGTLFLADEKGEVLGEVQYIGGIPVSEVIETIDTYYFYENAWDRMFIYSIHASHWRLLERAGAQMTADEMVIVAIYSDGVVEEVAIPVDTTFFDLFIARFPSADFIIQYEMIGDVFYIDFRTFIDGEHITAAAESIETAVYDGIRHFVIDLRGNGGGNSFAGQRLLNAMGLTMPGFGGVRRITPLAVEQRGGWHYAILSTLGYDYFSFAPDTTTADNPHNVFVSVLTDMHTYSSGTMMTAWVQDGNFGHIIGEPSRNYPSAFGDMLTFSLSYSGLSVIVSYSRFMRPDVNADQQTLWPDIIVDPSTALDVALEYFVG